MQFKSSLTDKTVNYKFLRKAEVLDLLGISAVTLWRWTRDGYFPRPVRLGPGGDDRGLVGFRSDQVATWIESRQKAGSDS